MPKVSVVVPIYNVSRYLSACIESILAQTFHDFEVILVDDESTDESPAICQRFVDPRIRYVRQKNRGLAGARNTGIRYATGQYVAFLDSDDLWAPHKLEKHVLHLDTNPDVGISYCISAFIDDAGESLNYYQSPKISNIQTSDIILRNPISNGSTPVIRRTVLDAIAFSTINLTTKDQEFQYFDETFRQSEDIECWLRIALTTDWKFAGVDDVLTYYRVNAGGLSANLEKQLEAWERCIDKSRSIAPAFIAKWESLARAFQLRYLARRALRQGNTSAAWKLLWRAAITNPGMLVREPARSLATIAAACVQTLVPTSVYRSLERSAMEFGGRVQKAAV